MAVDQVRSVAVEMEETTIIGMEETLGTAEDFSPGSGSLLIANGKLFLYSCYSNFSKSWLLLERLFSILHTVYLSSLPCLTSHLTGRQEIMQLDGFHLFQMFTGICLPSSS